MTLKDIQNIMLYQNTGWNGGMNKIHINRMELAETNVWRDFEESMKLLDESLKRLE